MQGFHSMRATVPTVALIAGVFAACAVLATPSDAADRRPNIIYIMADDAGYGDFSCHGQKKFSQTSTGWPRKACVSPSTMPAPPCALPPEAR
ncbi:MAG: hypothetical protein ACODAD_05640 [Planctomycetota bacterium]